MEELKMMKDLLLTIVKVVESMRNISNLSNSSQNTTSLAQSVSDPVFLKEKSVG